jgi:hypothetical protein
MIYSIFFCSDSLMLYLEPNVKRKECTDKNSSIQNYALVPTQYFLFMFFEFQPR